MGMEEYSTISSFINEKKGIFSTLYPYQLALNYSNIYLSNDKRSDKFWLIMQITLKLLTEFLTTEKRIRLFSLKFKHFLFFQIILNLIYTTTHLFKNGTHLHPVVEINPGPKS